MYGRLSLSVFVGVLAGLFPHLAGAADGPGAGSAEPVEIVVYKSPTCGCCGKWEDHLRRNGFEVVSKPVERLEQIKQAHGVAPALRSCHTALVNGYIIEGHVPAEDVSRLLAERPENIRGLSAPGMPQHSPGMQPEGLPPRDYDVIAFDKEGRAWVYRSYRSD